MGQVITGVQRAPQEHRGWCPVRHSREDSRGGRDTEDGKSENKLKSELCGWTAEEMIAGSEVVGARKAKAGVGSL